MTSLLEKLQSATEGSRALDDEILAAHDVKALSDEAMYRPRPSRNLQDAANEVPDGYDYTVGTRLRLGEQPYARVYRKMSAFERFKGDAPTESLALCIAIEKARNA